MEICHEETPQLNLGDHETKKILIDNILNQKVRDKE